MSIIKKTKNNFISISLLSIFDKIASFILVVLIARLLGSETYGEYAFAFAIAHILPALSDLGINILITRNVASDLSKQQSYLSYALGIKLIFTIAAFLLVLVLTQLIPTLRESSMVILLLCLSNLLRVLSATFTAIAQANLEMKYVAYSGTINRAVALVGGVIVLLLGKDLIAVLWIVLIASIIELIYISVLAYRRFTPFTIKFNFGEQKKMILASLPFFLLIALPVINYRLDSILLRFIDGKEATGIYNAAYVLILNLIIIQQIAGRVLLPFFSQFVSDQKQKFEKYYRQAVKVLVVFSLFVILAVQGFGKQIILVVFGFDYTASTQCLQILIFSVVFMVVSQILSTALIALKREKQVLKGWLAAVTANIILNLLLIPKFSYVGACYATVASEIILFVVCYYYLVIENRYSLLDGFEWLKLVVPFIAGLIFLAIFDWISVLFAAPLLLIIYGLFLTVGRTFSKDEVSDFVKFIRM